MIWIIGYILFPLAGGYVIWRKQGKYLTEDQPFAFVILGPIMPFICLLPKSFFTSREKAGIEDTPHD